MFYSRRYDFSTPHSNKEFIEDCTWCGWCRDNCSNKKIDEEYDTDVSDCVVNCSTCKNNVEFPPPHTCDICTSLDQEEEYGMWEAKE